MYMLLKKQMSTLSTITTDAYTGSISKYVIIITDVYNYLMAKLIDRYK